jgi:hypothetical protein
MNMMTEIVKDNFITVTLGADYLKALKVISVESYQI